MPAYRTVVVDDLPDAPNPTRHMKEVDEVVLACAACGAGTDRFGPGPAD